MKTFSYSGFYFLISSFFILFCSGSLRAGDGSPIRTGSAVNAAEDSSNNRVDLIRVNDTLWLHISYEMISGYNIPSNGSVIKTKDGLVLLDTPWNDAQTEELIRQCKNKFGMDIKLAVVTHSHNDRIGGIRTLLKNSVTVISSELTRRKAVQAGFPAPRPFYGRDTLLKFGGMEFDVYYPGGGHTEDNIVVWIPSINTLHGACLIKSAETTDMGNISEAKVNEWPQSIENILARYKDVKVVIPGHGATGGAPLLHHTLELVNNYLAGKKN